MTETEINARIVMLAKQRNDAMDAVAVLYGKNAALEEEIKKLKEDKGKDDSA